jgi:hypothetical protein
MNEQTPSNQLEMIEEDYIVKMKLMNKQSLRLILIQLSDCLGVQDIPYVVRLPANNDSRRMQRKPQE